MAILKTAVKKNCVHIFSFITSVTLHMAIFFWFETGDASKLHMRPPVANQLIKVVIFDPPISKTTVVTMIRDSASSVSTSLKHDTLSKNAPQFLDASTGVAVIKRMPSPEENTPPALTETAEQHSLTAGIPVQIAGPQPLDLSLSPNAIRNLNSWAAENSKIKIGKRDINESRFSHDIAAAAIPDCMKYNHTDRSGSTHVGGLLALPGILIAAADGKCK
jgi:hypothetical protein